MISICKAQKGRSKEIARLIIEAMTEECCLNFMNQKGDINDFYELLVSLVEREDSQYSYLNTLVAVDINEIVGICVSYDGAELKKLRISFIDECKRRFGVDHSLMPEETTIGEWYIDSLAVKKECRGRGIARQLINAVIFKAKEEKIEKVGLLVDNDNPLAEKLYISLGFVQVGVNKWGGHDMKHLQLSTSAL